MRSTKTAVLFGLGIFLIALAGMLRFYALPHLEKQPLDFYFTDVSSGQGTYFDAGSLSLKGPELLTASRTERGDVKAGTDSVAVWDIFTRVNNASGGLVDAFTERWAFDRKTGRSVSGYGETPPHSGQFLVWPFNAPKQTFPYYDQTAKASFPARYVDTEKLHGHTVYRYESVIPPTKIADIEVPGSLVGSPSASLTLEEYYSNPSSVALVDPRTGAVVGGSSHQIRTLRAPGSTEDLLTVLDVNLVATSKTVDGLLQKANDGAKQLNLLGFWAPLASLILGVGLVVAAVVLNRRPRTIVLPEPGAAAAAQPEAVQAAPVPATAQHRLPRQPPGDGQPPY